MIYAQIKAGQKLHLAYEPGEGADPMELVPAGSLSTPLCGQPMPQDGYRMNINVPLGNACKRCIKVWRARHAR